MTSEKDDHWEWNPKKQKRSKMDQEHEMGNNHNNLVSSSNLIQLKEEDLTKLQNFKTARYVS